MSSDLPAILVTGGAGYIGSHACKHLKQAGYLPVTFDNLSTGWRDAVRFGPFVCGDLLNKNDIVKVFEKYSPIAVMHFASHSQVGESVNLPGKYWENNVMGALNLVQSSIEHNCLDFVFSSTCAVYGDQDSTTLTEISSELPDSPYAKSKRAIENILFDYERAFNLKHVIFRYFNVSGADPDAEIGEFHVPETHLIPLLLDVAAGKRKEFTVYGTDYNTPDGSCVRDFVHVTDLIDAHVLGLQWLQQSSESKIFNLGSGHGFSVLEVVEAVKRITNRRLPIQIGNRRLGDSERLVSSSDRAKIELGWSPKRSSLHEIIMDSWNWHKTKYYRK